MVRYNTPLLGWLVRGVQAAKMANRYGHGHGHHDGLRVALDRVSVTKASDGSWSLWFFILGRQAW
jgi:hypothetical protein